MDENKTFEEKAEIIEAYDSEVCEKETEEKGSGAGAAIIVGAALATGLVGFAVVGIIHTIKVMKAKFAEKQALKAEAEAAAKAANPEK